MEERGIGRAVFFPFEEALRDAGDSAGTSAKLFHVPHSGHRPSHRGSWCPQPEHSKRLFDFDTGLILPLRG
jgi:hypothetical protein